MMYSEPEGDYFARPGVSASLLKAMAISPAHARAIKEGRKPTPDQQLGTLIHRAILEPEKLQGIPIKPEWMSFATKDGKVWRECNPVHMTQDDNWRIKGVMSSIKRHPTARRLLELPGNSELTLTSEDCACPMKGRLDRLCSQGRFILDIKTTQCAEPGAFSYEIAKYKYELQAAWYMDLAKENGISIEAFLFLAVEKESPYAVSVIQLDNASIQRGRERNSALLNKYLECVEKDHWPAYSEQIVQVSIPRYAMSDKPQLQEYEV